jgi:hypothetical protein
LAFDRRLECRHGPILHSAAGVRNNLSRIRRSLVSGRPVHTRDGDVIQAEVDAQVRSVVDQVVHDHPADHGGPRHGEDLLAGLQQAPRFVHLVVSYLRDRLPRGGNVPVEDVEDLLPAGCLRELVARAATGAM